MKTIPPGLLEEITRRLVDELQPDQIVLFGSHAWGTPDEGSDLDLLVVVPGDDGVRSAIELRARRCLREVRVPKDILVRSRVEMERLGRVPSSLEREILERGLVLYGRREAPVGGELARQS